MTGETEGRASAGSYGVYFEPTDYVLFYNSYSGDSSKLTIKLSEGMRIASTTFSPTPEIIFDQGSGEINGLSSTGSVTLETPSGQQKTVTFNKYGAITSIE
jgi:hypothetical protein